MTMEHQLSNFQENLQSYVTRSPCFALYGVPSCWFPRNELGSSTLERGGEGGLYRHMCLQRRTSCCHWQQGCMKICLCELWSRRI